MKIHVPTLCVSALCVSAIAPTLFAQGTQQPESRPTPAIAEQPRAATTPDYVKLDKLIGADVKLQPSAEERREAAESGDAADRPTGEIKDLIIETRTGKTAWAIMAVDEGILGIGGKNVAVPTKSLRWNAANETFELDVSEDRLGSLPEFDLEKAQEGSIDTAIQSLKSNWKEAVGDAARAARDAAGRVDGESAAEQAARDAERTAREAAAEVEERLGGDRPDGQMAMPRSSRLYVCASQIDDLPVYAQSTEFGGVDAVLIDRANHCVDLLVVSHGGTLGMGATKILLPYDGLVMCRKADADADEDDEDALLYSIDRPAAELSKSAVKYEEPETGVVDPDEAKRAKEMFGAEKHSSKKTGERGALDNGARDPDRGGSGR